MTACAARAWLFRIAALITETAVPSFAQRVVFVLSDSCSFVQFSFVKSFMKSFVNRMLTCNVDIKAQCNLSQCFSVGLNVIGAPIMVPWSLPNLSDLLVKCFSV